jgi:hypothetical protein
VGKAIAGLIGELHHGSRAEASVEVVVEYDLRGTADLVRVRYGRSPGVRGRGL